MLTGREPVLATDYQKGGLWKISPRRLATMLNTLPPDKISLPAAAAALHHDNFDVRYNAAYLLSRRGDRESRLIMQEALDQGSIPTQANIARHLSGFSFFSATHLLQQALNHDDLRVREAAVYALCDYVDPQAYQMTAGALANEADDVLYAAAVALRDRQDPEAVPVLAAALHANDPEVRVQALQSLGANHTPGAWQPVQATLFNDPDPTVVYEAALSLVELARAEALPILTDAINSRNGQLQASVIRGMFHATNYTNLDPFFTDGAEGLLDALEDAMDNPLARHEVIWPLAWSRYPAAGILLLRIFENTTDHQLQTHILRTAWSLMSETRERLLELARVDNKLYKLAEILDSRDAAEFDVNAVGTGFVNPVLGR